MHVQGLAGSDLQKASRARGQLLEVAADPFVTFELTEKCDEGDVVACDVLSKEEEAKKAWLARLDAPTWGAVAAAVTAVAEEAFESLVEEVSAAPGLEAAEFSFGITSTSQSSTWCTCVRVYACVCVGVWGWMGKVLSSILTIF